MKKTKTSNQHGISSHLFSKQGLRKKMDIATVGNVMDNLKMDPNKPVMKFAAKMNSNFSQLKELIPRGQFNNIPAAPADSINVVCKGIHGNTIPHADLQYLKYFFIAGLPKAIMQLVAAKDRALFTEANNETMRLQELTKAKNDNTSLAHTIEQYDVSVNQIKGNRTQNLYQGNYRGRGGCNRGAPQGAPSVKGGYNIGGGNGNQNQQKLSGDNQYQNTNKPTCWYCSIYGHHQEDC